MVGNSTGGDDRSTDNNDMEGDGEIGIGIADESFPLLRRVFSPFPSLLDKRPKHTCCSTDPSCRVRWHAQCQSAGRLMRNKLNSTDHASQPQASPTTSAESAQPSVVLRMHATLAVYTPAPRVVGPMRHTRLSRQ